MGPSMSIDGVTSPLATALAALCSFNGAVDEHRRSPAMRDAYQLALKAASMGPSMSIDGVRPLSFELSRGGP